MSSVAEPRVEGGTVALMSMTSLSSVSVAEVWQRRGGAVLQITAPIVPLCCGVCSVAIVLCCKISLQLRLPAFGGWNCVSNV